MFAPPPTPSREVTQGLHRWRMFKNPVVFLFVPQLLPVPFVFLRVFPFVPIWNIFAMPPGSHCDLEKQRFASLCFSLNCFQRFWCAAAWIQLLMCFLKSLSRLVMVPSSPPLPPPYTPIFFFSSFFFPQSIEFDTGSFLVLHFKFEVVTEAAEVTVASRCFGGSPTGRVRCSPSFSHISNKVSSH